MSYIGMPYDETYYKGTRIEGYTDYSDMNPQIWTHIADDIEAQTGLVSGKRVLDIGCAYGYLVNELASRGANITGIDISDYAIAQAQSLFPLLDFRVMDGTSMTFAVRTFDIIIGLGVVECIPTKSDAQAMLREVRRIGKTTLRLYILENLSSGFAYDYLTKAEWNTYLTTTWTGKTVTITDTGNLPIGYDIRATVM